MSIILEQDYNQIAQRAYDVDINKEGVKRPEKDDLILDGNYIVLKTEDNIDNGMQAMAVAPVDKNGLPDCREVVIAYAGTNSSDIKDIETDLQSIGLGSQKLQYRTGVNTAKATESQFLTAIDFAQAVEKEVKEKNPDAVITTTGHSLGQSLAMYVGLKQGYANVGYNGPDIHNMISDKEIMYMQEHSEQFRNYRNKHDDIGNITGNKTKTAIYPKVTKGKDKFKNTLSDHLLSQWQFTNDGHLKDLDGKVVTDNVVTSYAHTTAAMARIKSKSKKLAKRGYSAREQIFLDTIQGSAIAQGMAAAAQAGVEDISRTVVEGINKAQALWDAIDFNTYQELSYDEVVGLFAEQGVTYDSIVIETETVLNVGSSKAVNKSEEFANLNGQIESMIQQHILTDKKLAEDISNWTS